MTKLSDFNEFLEKRQMSPFRPGLFFDEQKHRWVRSGKEEKKFKSLPQGITKTGSLYHVKDKESLKQLTQVEDGATIKIGDYYVKVKFSNVQGEHWDIPLASTIESFKTGKVLDSYHHPVFLDKFLTQVKEINTKRIKNKNKLEKAPTQDKNLHLIILDDGSIYLKYIGYDMFIDIPEDIELVKSGEVKYIDCILWSKNNSDKLEDLKKFMDKHNQDEVTILVCDRDKKIFDNYEGDKSFLKVKTFKLENNFEVFGVNIIPFILSGDLEDNISFRIGDGLCYVWKSDKDIDSDVVQYCNNVEAIITNTTDLSIFSGLRNVNKIYTPKDVGEEIIIERNEVVKSIEDNSLLNIIKQGKQIGIFLDGSYRDISYIFPEIVGYLESVPEDFILKGLVNNKNIILENIDEKNTTEDFYNKYLSNNDNFILG